MISFVHGFHPFVHIFFQSFPEHDRIRKTNGREKVVMREYSIWSNFKFAYGPVWKEKRVYIWDMILEIFFSVAVPLVGSALSAFIIWLLGNEIKVVTIMISIITVFLGNALINAFQTFLVQKHSAHNIEIRLELFFMQVMKKQLNMTLEKSESANIRLLEEKADMAISNNWAGIEGFFRYGTRLGVGIAGLIVYSCIAGTVHPLILVMLLALSIISALIDSLPQRYQNRTKDEKAKYNVTMGYIDRVVDDIPAGKDIRVFGLSSWIIDKYDKCIMGKRHLDAGKNILAYVGATAEITLSAVRDLVCYLYLIHCLQSGMSIAEFVFYLGIIAGFSGWFNRVSQNAVAMKNCSKQISDIRAVLDLEEDEPSEKLIPENSFHNIDIVFDHVSYSYGDAEQPVLDDVSFHIGAGEHVALVGRNGAGKSTIAKLLTGLYLPTGGEVYINGISTKNLNLQEYYKRQAAVFQDTFVLAYTIAENIALSDTWDERKIWECLGISGLEQKIRNLPDGLKTYLGKDLYEQGITLSGGETQKLLLARALYRNPVLILLDEPTAALDALAEAEIYEIYSQSLAEVTSLFISHRLASTRFCHNILVLAEGKIVEQGNHEQLMKKQGTYYELFKVQSRYYEDGGVANVG